MKKLRFPPSGPRALSRDMFVSAADQEQQYRELNAAVTERVAALGRDPLWAAAAMARDLYLEGLRARDIAGPPDVVQALEAMELADAPPEERARIIVRRGVACMRRAREEEEEPAPPPRNREERRAAKAVARSNRRA